MANAPTKDCLGKHFDPVEFDVEECAVFPLAPRRRMHHTAILHGMGKLGGFLLVVRSDQVVKILPLNFGLGVQKHLLEGRIAKTHKLILVFDDDSQRDVRNQCVHVHGVLFQFLLRAPGCGDVQRRSQDGWLAVEFRQRARRNPASVSPRSS